MVLVYANLHLFGVILFGQMLVYSRGEDPRDPLVIIGRAAQRPRILISVGPPHNNFGVLNNSAFSWEVWGIQDDQIKDFN